MKCAAAAAVTALIVLYSHDPQFLFLAGAAAIGLNARVNGVPAPAIVGDVLDSDGAGADVVLAGDVWYSRPLAERVLGFLDRAVARGASVLAGDIGRPFLPRERFRVLDASDIPVMAGLEDSGVKRTMVLEPIREAPR